MPSSHLKINNISLYFLPLAAFFLLISSAATNIFIVLSVISSIYLCIKNSEYEILIKENFFKVSILLYLLLVLYCIYSIGNKDQITDVLKIYVKFRTQKKKLLIIIPQFFNTISFKELFSLFIHIYA